MTAVDTHLLLRALVDEFARCGMTTAVTCPGSRNTPIVEALVAEPRLTPWSHIDERCAGFFALGAAKASAQPVAVTVTSGSAVANLMPAVVEASEAGVPLILLTADRPAELRQIGAGQTIDQVKLFGPYVRFFAELELSEATPERLRWIRALACRAYWTALDGHPGPVHLNLPLREPLVVDGPLPEDPEGGGSRAGGAPWVGSVATELNVPSGDIEVTPRTLVVAGATTPAVADAAARFCERHGFPLLADPLSGARKGPAAIAHYDLLLREPAFTAQVTPELIIRVGDLPTSKPLRQWLAGVAAVAQITLATERSWADPASVVNATIAVDPVAVFDGARFAGRYDPAWLETWRAADARAAAAIQATVGAELSEPTVATTLAAELPPWATLVVAASMPIRDVEEFFAVRQRPPRVLANRGANGIDGTVSTAFGVAAVAPDGEPTVLLIGDVALLHDIGGLLTARRSGLTLTVVLINNDGGGIFNFLAIAEGHDAAFAEHVATPHGTDFGQVAALYGLQHVTPSDVGGFTAALNRALASDTSTLIEVRTDRAQNRRLHAEIERAARAALAPRTP
jgi:2-succinyl-5-enolpyruvyl-6-hydroxy-3-cyclohexene-1-carboxylate synthase